MHPLNQNPSWTLAPMIAALLLGALLVPHQTHAQTARLRPVRLPIPPLTDIIKTESGNVHFLTQVEANRYCRQHHLRLPYLAELALESQLYGTTTLESSFVPEGTPGTRYNTREYLNARKEELSRITHELSYPYYVIGYRIIVFNWQTYRPPNNEIGQLVIWSNSTYYDDEETQTDLLAQYYSGTRGPQPESEGLPANDPRFRLAFRCAKRQ